MGCGCRVRLIRVGGRILSLDVWYVLRQLLVSEDPDGFGLERAGTAAVLLQGLFVRESFCVGSGFIHYSSKEKKVTLASYMWSCL